MAYKSLNDLSFCLFFPNFDGWVDSSCYEIEISIWLDMFHAVDSTFVRIFHY